MRYQDSAPPTYLHYFARLVGALVALKLGYWVAVKEAAEENKSFLNNKVVEFEAEEQIFVSLLKEGKTAVFLNLYIPGNPLSTRFKREMEIASTDPDFADIEFMQVQCRKHTYFCASKINKDKVAPYAEVYYINEQDKIELLDFGTWHRSKEGIRGFLEEASLVEPKLAPGRVLDVAGGKLAGVF